MILNAFAVVVGTLALLRFSVAGLIVALARPAVCHAGAPRPLVEQEQRGVLLGLLGVVLLGLNLGSWPFFYALLQSYVPQWPGVMCIFGVTRIGLGSQGWSRLLPDLVIAIQFVKPLAVFASGAWLVLHLVNRQLLRSELLPRVVTWILVLAVFSAADGVLEGAYLVIPKSEEFLDAGCCTAAASGSPSERFLAAGRLTPLQRHWLRRAMAVLAGGLPLCLLAGALADGRSWIGRLWYRPAGMTLLLLAAAGSLPAGWLYLVEIAAPEILGLPYHHCPYDLVARAPETILGIAGYLFGAFALGWAWLLHQARPRVAPESHEPPHLGESDGESDTDAEPRRHRVEVIAGTIPRLIFLSACAYLYALVLFALESAGT